MGIVGELHRDAKLLMASRGIRAFAFSYLNVIFAIYLDRLGYTPVSIGVVYSVAYLSGAVLTALWGYLSDRYGRRNILMLLALLTIVSNAIFVFFSSLFFILLAVIIANVGAGGSGGGGSGGGPFNPVEEALLAEKCLPENIPLCFIFCVRKEIVRTEPDFWGNIIVIVNAGRNRTADTA